MSADLIALNELARDFERMMDNAATASQHLDLADDRIVREAVKMNVFAPMLVLLAERDQKLREAASALEAAEARIASVRDERVEEWRPIETAPRADGVTVLLGWNVPGHPSELGFWSGDYHGLHAWCDEHYENSFKPQPTHWRPLPAPPAPKQEGA